MKNSVRIAFLSTLGFAAVLAATTGFQLAGKPVNTKEHIIQVPGSVIQKNLDTLMSNPDSEIPGVIRLPGLDSAEGVALPVVEGFNNTSAGLPAAVRTAWNASVMLLGAEEQGTSIGTGFIVKMKREGDRNLIYVMTNNHVIEDSCSTFTNQCPNLFTLNGIGLNSRTGEVFRTGENLLRVRGARLIKTTRPPDLALLEVEVEASALSFLSVVPVANRNAATNTSVYAIGHPSTDLRKSSSRKHIQDQHLLIKRWSSGHVEEVGHLQGQGELVVHTADILPGNSGGALVSADGIVVGVNVLLFNVRKDFDYNGGGCGLPPTARAAVGISEVIPYMQIANGL